MLNSFPAYVKNLWIHDPLCRLCKKRMAWEVHHVHSRGGTKRNRLMSSAYNASPLCRICHNWPQITSLEIKDILTKDTQHFLSEQGYKPNEKDKLFLEYIKTI